MTDATPGVEADNAASFDDLRRDKSRRREMRKRLLWETHDGKVGRFTYRALTESESDAIRMDARRTPAANGDLSSGLDMEKFRTKIIKTGVTDGPDGFTKNSESHAEKLPDALREELADAIVDFSDMDEETRVNF